MPGGVQHKALHLAFSTLRLPFSNLALFLWLPCSVAVLLKTSGQGKDPDGGGQPWSHSPLNLSGFF